MAYKVMFTADEFVKKLIHIAVDLPTIYKNSYPYNLGYYHSGGYWSFDCWNLIKAVIWGWEEKKTVGYYQRTNSSTGLGDWTGGTILNNCSDVSTDFHFKNLVPGEFLLTGDKGHAGTYVGEQIYDGRIYNVVECTPIWGGGVQLAYVDEQGRRLSYKGGPQRSSWTHHGKLPWIDYTDTGCEPAPVEPEPAKPEAPKFEKGDMVEVLNPITYTGKRFHLYYEVYTVIEAKGDRIVIGVNNVVTAAVNANNLKKIDASPKPNKSDIQVDDKVKVLKAVTYTGHPFHLWYKEYQVIELIGDRAVIGVNGVVTAAINVKNLEKI